MKFLQFILLFIPFLLFGQEKGNAGVNALDLHGRKTASGKIYDKNEFSASHKTIPFGTWISVKNVSTGLTTEVKINDRGPYTGNRILDLSTIAAKKIGIKQGDIAYVEIEILGKAYTPSTEVEVMPVFKERATKSNNALKNKQENIRSAPKSKGSLSKNKTFTSNLLGINMYNVSKKGHAIQMGIFSSFENIYLQVSILPNAFQANAIVLPFKKKGKLIYKLLLGPYDSKHKATVDQKKMRKFVKDCIVVNLENL